MDYMVETYLNDLLNLQLKDKMNYKCEQWLNKKKD